MGWKDFIREIGQRLGRREDNPAPSSDRGHRTGETPYPRSIEGEVVRELTEGILIEDEHGRITYVNPRTEEMLGYGPGDLIGHNWDEIIPEEYTSIVQEQYATRQLGVRSRYEAALLAKDGRRIPVIVSARPHFEAGKFSGVVVVFTDISEQKEAEKETKHHLQEFVAMNRVALAVAASLKLDEALERTIQALVESLGYPNVAILLLDPQAKELRLHPSYQGVSREKVFYPLTIPLGRGITGWVAEHGEPILAPDVFSDTRYIHGIPDTKSEMCVPLKVGQKTIGVINVESPARGAFFQHDLELLTTIASQVATLIENARLHEETNRHLEEFTILNRVAMAVASALDLDEALERTTNVIFQTLAYPTVGILLLDQTTQELRVHPSYRAPSKEAVSLLVIPLGQGITGFVAKSGEPILVPDVSLEPRYIQAIPETKSEMCVPLRARNKIIGVLNVESPVKGGFTKHDLDLLNTIASQVAILIENARLYEETKQLAITDGLTGLYNLRYFYQELGKEIGKSDRYQRPLSLIMLDIDEFKRYNDLYGHLAGDDLLKELAQLTQGLIRKTDTLARYGGEEFFIILPETEPEEAHTLAQRIVDTVRETRFLVRDGTRRGQITISCGVATYPIHADSAKALIQAADSALYQAKKTKDRIWTFTPTTGQLPTPLKTTAQKVKATSKSQK